MAIVVKKGGSYTPPPAGTHRAVCYGIIDLGTQENNYKGNVSYSSKLQLLFELADEYREYEGEEYRINVPVMYTAMLSDKSNLQRDIKSWMPELLEEQEFDIKKVVGESCLMTIVHETKEDGSPKHKITGITGLPKGMAPAEPERDVVIFDFASKDALEVFGSLTEFQQKLIKESPEYEETFGYLPPPPPSRDVQRDARPGRTSRTEEEPARASQNSRTVTRQGTRTGRIPSRAQSGEQEPRTDVF